MLTVLSSIASNGSNAKQIKKPRSIKFNGINYLYSNQTLSLGEQAFTVDFWIRPRLKIIPNFTTSEQILINSVDEFRLSWSENYNLRFSLKLKDKLYRFEQSVPAEPYNTPNKWYHVAFVRHNGLIQLYVDGQRQPHTPYTNGWNYISSQLITLNGFQIGFPTTNPPASASDVGASGAAPDTLMSSIRFSKFARYTENFTPSNAPIETNVNIYAGFNFENSASIKDVNNNYTLFNVGNVQFVNELPPTPIV